jgi:DNA-binding transcriptional regulator YdaS (Cro superfamily)
MAIAPVIADDSKRGSCDGDWIESATGGLVKRHELRPDIADAPAVTAPAEEGA